jgi:hypothetical protein
MGILREVADAAEQVDWCVRAGDLPHHVIYKGKAPGGWAFWVYSHEGRFDGVATKTEASAWIPVQFVRLTSELAERLVEMARKKAQPCAG